MNITMVKCDGCGKLTERQGAHTGEPGGELPRGWRVLRLPFSGSDREACSPGCAYALLGQDVDEEWGVNLTRHQYLGGSALACEACGKAPEHPAHAVQVATVDEPEAVPA